MNKILNILVSLGLILISCSDRDTVSDTLIEVDSDAIVITVSGDISENNIETRALLTKDEVNNKINVRWNENDKVYLYAIQGESLIKLQTAVVRNIRDDNKKADFDIVLSPEITSEFKLIGSMSPLIHTEDGTLESYSTGMMPLENLREIPRYFEVEGITLDNAENKLTSVNFHDPGILILLNVKNISGTNLSREFDIPFADWNSNKTFATGLNAGNDIAPATNNIISIPAGEEKLLAAWRFGNLDAETPKSISVSMNLSAKKDLAILLKGRQNPFQNGKAYTLPEMEWDGGRISNANGNYMEFTYIPSGTFLMGSTTETDPVRQAAEGPQHEVTLDGFWMAKTLVTQEQWLAVEESDPSFWKSPSNPVERVSWLMAGGNDGYITKLNNQIGITNLRLPTEAEWEYACRAGTTTPFYSGDCLTNEDANYLWSSPYNGCSNSVTTKDNGTHPVGTYPANPWGLYDMSGNVWEWCSDYNGSYTSEPKVNPTGPSTGDRKILRGGSWIGSAENSRSARRFNRVMNDPGNSTNAQHGFRIAFSEDNFSIKLKSFKNYTY